MFTHKTQSSFYSAAIGAALVVSIAVVVTALLEAVVGVQSFL